jgi:hypothetical protein
MQTLSFFLVEVVLIIRDDEFRPSRLSVPHFAQRTATLIAGPALSVSGTGFSL